MSDIVLASREVLSTHARSFRWGAAFLPADRRDDASVLYAFCRLVDDLADEARDTEQAAVALQLVREELDGHRDPRPVVRALLSVAESRHMDLRYAHQLIEGVESDLGVVVFQDEQELLRYSYRVAGTVGLMMCAVLGVHDRNALAHAVDLGVAMQLTNICRDVLEDAGRGRVYLPAAWLREHGVDPGDILEGRKDHATRDGVMKVVLTTLDKADAYYQSADKGMRYIPARSRFAILVAARLYRAIGWKLRENGGDALAGRTWIGWGQKSAWLARASFTFLGSRLRGDRERAPHDARLHQALKGLPGIR